jgi:hypothetical protein
VPHTCFFKTKVDKNALTSSQTHCFSKMKKKKPQLVPYIGTCMRHLLPRLISQSSSLLFYFISGLHFQRKREKKNAIPNPDQMNSSKDKEEENEQNEICFTQINLINLTPSMSLFNTHRHRHGRNQQVNKKERKNYHFFFLFYIEDAVRT